MTMWEMDYESAAKHWVEKDKESAHMEEAALKERIEGFIAGHNTCALATASADMVRNTPIEYNYVDGEFYFFSEGGLKFKGLKENKNVGLAIFEPYGGFGNLKSLQVEGVASMVEPFSEEYLKVMEFKKIPVEAMKKLPQPMNLIKVVARSYDYLDSELKKEGFSSRQHLEK
ncbi:pyridoxamine 5'-phosphate oxidase family protein [Butyrivibrio proteoclasticus]|uniref:pyridoxamine 5'-phosphate oxidase family protein n=1 Tax=Butyrivibrio proteoclasticus TaxID=43305 RepID=UPI00055534EA|nr:pyridoxamine 5'-phosphate oxidase family protein [Butyrivibrio proteoclasticus]